MRVIVKTRALRRLDPRVRVGIPGFPGCVGRIFDDLDFGGGQTGGLSGDFVRMLQFFVATRSPQCGEGGRQEVGGQKEHLTPALSPVRRGRQSTPG